MISTARATRSERWSPSTCLFEFEPNKVRGEGTKSGNRGRGSRPFASATASLSEGVMTKPTASYSPPPPKPKVSNGSGCFPLLSAGVQTQAPMTRTLHFS